MTAKTFRTNPVVTSCRISPSESGSHTANSEPTTFAFTADLRQLGPTGGAHLVEIPAKIADALRQGERRARVWITLFSRDGQSGPRWHAGLNPYGGGRFYVQVGRNYHEPLDYAIGDTLSLEVVRDDSTYGMQPCEEFLAVAEADVAGQQLFQTELTSGTQRSILHRIAQARTSDGRIERALRIFDQLHLGLRERQVLLASIRAEAMRDASGLVAGSL